jgi:GDPmannose 4,6-dehydratase
MGVSRSEEGIQGDVSDYNFVLSTIKKYQPTYVFHLAANSTVAHDALFENHETISTGTLNILASVKIESPSTKIFITGSGVQFKNDGLPISENSPFEASSPYAVARIQSAYAARYFRSMGIRAYVGYLFHHESPLRRSHHMSQRIVRFVQRLRNNGGSEKLELGDISVEKEWGFAGDIAAGILALVEQDEVFEATIGTGIAYTIEHWLNLCFGHIDKDWKEYVKLRSDFTPEFNKMVSNPDTMRSINWTHKTSVSQLARLMMDQNESNSSH